jgi:hypothetical protein
MKQHCRPRHSQLWMLTTDKGTSRPDISAIAKRITKLQCLHRLPPYRATVFETGGGLHAHMIFIANCDIIKRLRSSAIFGATIQADPVYNATGLSHGYLVKERTSQAGYGRERLLGGRIKGSHRLEGGGDRVRLSRALEQDAIEAGYVQPWLHTNARRK